MLRILLVALLLNVLTITGDIRSQQHVAATVDRFQAIPARVLFQVAISIPIQDKSGIKLDSHYGAKPLVWKWTAAPVLDMWICRICRGGLITQWSHHQAIQPSCSSTCEGVFCHVYRQ